MQLDFGLTRYTLKCIIKIDYSGIGDASLASSFGIFLISSALKKNVHLRLGILADCAACERRVGEGVTQL